jgi:hypothetical protein
MSKKNSFRISCYVPILDGCLGSRSFQGNQSGEAILFFDSIKISKEENIIPASIPAPAILTDGKK